MWFRLALVLSLSVVAGCSLVFSADTGNTPDAAEAPVAPDAGDETSLCVGALPNGSLEGVEECDDGNQEADDACTHLCRFARCGDGIVRDFVESCDDASETCVNCVTCDDRLEQNHAGMVDGRCYIIHQSVGSWQEGRRRCIESYQSELAALDALPDPDQQTVNIIEALKESPVGLMNDLPSQLWLGLEYNSGWSWLGSKAGVGSSWEGDIVPTDQSTPPTISVDEPTIWVPTDQSEQHSALCMRGALPDFNSTSRMVVSEATHHIYIEQIGTLRTSGGVGTYDEHKVLCEKRGAHLATFEEVGDAAEIAPDVVSDRPSYVGARRESAIDPYIWNESGEFVDPSLWKAGEGPDDILTFQCATLTATGELKVENCGLTGLFAICEWD